MDNDNIVQELTYFENEILSVHNKVQESVNLAREGKWYHSDTKMQGVKQKILNLYENVKSLKRELNENSSN